ncbi:MAG: TlpA disulfide reductase family protein [Acidobacteriota bacterium]
MKKTLIFILLNLLFAFSFVNLNAQIKVPLRVDESAKSVIGQYLFCDKEYNCGLLQNEKIKTSRIINGETPAKIWRTGKNFYLQIDTNLNNKLTDEKKLLLENNSKVIVKIKRKLTPDKFLFLPYEISHQTYEKDGQIIDSFKIVPHYVAVGTLSFKDCSSKIAFSDMDYDGNISMSDAERGTNFHIDRNNDSKFWGKEEHNKTNEIIEFCGQNFLVTSLNNANLTLMPTDLKIAKVGEPAPKFSFVLLNGEVVSSDNLKGKYYVLDFWASWCVPCVKNLPHINLLKKDFEDRISVFSVNVDEPSRKNFTEKIINENQMFDFSIIRGAGEDDLLWKTFGGANLNKLSIPLYILIDNNGIVRYADNGGEDLGELKSSIEKILSSR